MEFELDLKQYFNIIMKKIWFIVACVMTIVVIASIINYFVITKIYQSNTLIYIANKVENTQSTTNYTDVMLNGQLVKDYRELVKSRQVSNLVIDHLGLENITVNQLSSMINVNSKNDTRLLEISVQNADPKLAQDIANEVAKVFQVKVSQIMNAENVQIIDEAVYPKIPIKPNKKMNIAIAGILGIMVGIGIVLLIEFLNQTIRTVEDVENHVQLPILGTIPNFKE